jgi:pimeloyl-ACP methyl ester carboxylesterase
MRLNSGRIEVELHELSSGSGRALLLLHDLYGSAADWGEGFAPWPGPVYALDFAGHGRSQWIKGGAYTPEICAVDVDAALRQVGSACLVGAGIGAYVALLVGAARRDIVPSVLLLPGIGLEGGGPTPDFDGVPRSIGDLATPRQGCDPMVAFLEHDVRPSDYAAAFAAKVERLLLLDDGTPRPPWWNAARGVAGVQTVGDVADGLAKL